jgi:opacity protein-like surface antigen
MKHLVLFAIYAVLLLAAAVAAVVANKPTTLLTRIGLVFAQIVAWTWGLFLSVGGVALLLHEGPWPLTNGWFAMFSGVAACPLTAWFLKKYVNIKVPLSAQLAVALLISIAGRIAVVFVLHRPFLPDCSGDCW